MMSAEDRRAAQWSGVRLRSSKDLALAFLDRRSRIISTSPLPAARWSAVWPRVSDWFTEQPESSSSRTVSGWVTHLISNQDR